MSQHAMVAALLDAAHRAGQAVMRHRVAGVSAELKADSSPVTAADHEAEAIILEILAQVAPGVSVIAEEEAAAGRLGVRADRFFLVDPLDGTREYVSGGDDFTVNIALIEDGVPVLGIVYAPASARIYWGDTDGAWRAHLPLDGERAPAERIGCASSTPRPRAVASRSHATPETETYLAACGAGERLSIGSSLKFLLVAEGSADLYPRAGPTMEWDTAAGDAVLRAAGGMTYDLDGAPLGYGKPHYFNPGFVAVGRCAPPPPLGPFYPNRQTVPGARA